MNKIVCVVCQSSDPLASAAERTEMSSAERTEIEEET